MGRDAAKNEAQRQRRRETILQGALELFAERGLAATKIADIAKRTGMSMGLCYRYFPSKDALFVFLLNDAFDRLEEACRRLEEMALDPAAKLAFALAGLVEGLRDDPDAARYHVVIAQAQLSQAMPLEARELLARRAKAPYEVIARIVAEGQREGTVCAGEPRQLATLFWTTIKGLALHRAAWGPDTLPPSTLIEPLFLISKSGAL